jgi:hypothetical protein
MDSMMENKKFFSVMQSNFNGIKNIISFLNAPFYNIKSTNIDTEIKISSRILSKNLKS